ncbi:unnamed protein product [Ectocarpus fasciculatus]
MNQKLPTFRAGGLTSRIDLVRGDHKSALAPSYFSHNHFSSPLAGTDDPLLKRTRVTVKILEGKNLLVSDLLTGTSDPITFLWVSSTESGYVDLKHDRRVQSTEVRKHTVDPVWDAEFVFPLEVQSVEDVLSGRINILVRDHDDADGDLHYIDLGRVEVPLETVLTEGNIMAHTQLVQLPARWYPLQRCRGMKKSRGALKLAVGFFVGSDCVLLRDGDNDTLGQSVGTAARFEHHMKRFRGCRRSDGCGRAASMSPPRRTPANSQELTVRGGTVVVRPKSAPEATTLTCPMHLQQRPFELKPVQPRNPSADFQMTDATQAESKDWAETPTLNAILAETAPVVEQRPRWRDTYGMAAAPDEAKAMLSSVGSERAELNQTWGGLPATPSRVPALTKPSPKLSRLAANAAHEATDRGKYRQVGWDQQEGATVRAHRWQRKLLESMQRLETRSTEGVAYGELRAMVREASSVQVGQVVTAARGVGTSCSLAARRYTLRLLAWLCWDQPRAASRHHASIVSYVLDRIRDDETASLHAEMSLCIGAVMLSALRDGTVDQYMVQTRRLLRLVGEQRPSVRESAGVCCVASVLPPSPHVPVEAETGLRNIHDVRLAIGQAAERGGIANPVPKEAVLLPGGRAVIELADAAAAASFFDRLSVTAAGLPANWNVCPFPEDFCTGVNLAQASHHARLTVNSEEILACLLEALGNGRSEATRAQLFNAIAAMARSCVTHGDTELQAETGTPTTVVATAPRGVRVISATFKKGLPAVARAVLEVLNCPIRRAYTWKEREAALEVITCLAVLVDLRGVEGPLGEHRAKFVQGATGAKHDSVAAVREAARKSLVALEATDAEEGKRKNCPRLLPQASVGPHTRGGKDAEISSAGMIRRLRPEKTGQSKAVKKQNVNPKIDGVVLEGWKAEECMTEPPPLKLERNQDSSEMDSRARRQREAEVAEEKKLTAGRTSTVSSLESCPSSNRVSDKQDTPQPSETSLRPSSSASEGCRSDRRRGPTHSVNTRSPGEHDPSSGDLERKGNMPSEEDLPTPNKNDDAPGKQQEKKDGTPLQQRCTPMETLVAQPVPQPVQTAPASTVQSVGVAVQGMAPPETKGLETLSNETSRAPATTLVQRPVRDGAQVDTVRLLKHLDDKTNGIVSVLDCLDRRLVGMEKILTSQEQTCTTASPMRSPASRKLKRPRVCRNAGSEKRSAPNRTGISSNTDLKGTDNELRPSATSKKLPARRTTRLRRDVGQLVKHGEIEHAFRTALSSGTERDVLWLMGSAGGPDLCRHRLGMETRDRLFAFVARVVSAGKYAEHALPWVFELVRAGEAKGLPLAVRMQLAGALHGLAASPTDHGVMAARLGPYLSLVSLGRPSMSDTTEGGGVFGSMGLASGV